MNCNPSYCFYSKYRYAHDGTLKLASCTPLFCDPKMITIKVSKKWAESQAKKINDSPSFHTWKYQQLMNLYRQEDNEILKQNT